jgi:hypothetical protein
VLMIYSKNHCLERDFFRGRSREGCCCATVLGSKPM